MKSVYSFIQQFKKPFSSLNWIFSFSKKNSINEAFYDHSKLTKWRLGISSYIIITAIFCPYLNRLVSDFNETNSFSFYYYIIICSFINFFIFSRFVTLKEYKFDLLLKLSCLFFKNFFLFINLIRIKLIKLWFFLVNQSQKQSYWFTYIKLVTTNLFVFWRPLFKRFSYFGSYKNTRSKFNNLN